MLKQIHEFSSHATNRYFIPNWGRYILLWMKALITTVSMEKRMEQQKNIIMILLLTNLAMYLT